MIMSQNVKTVFSGYTCTASTNYVYTSVGSTDGESGWFDVSGYDEVLIGIRVATLTATRLRYRIEGRSSDVYTNVMNIYTASIAAAQTVDDTINIFEKVKQVRVGVKVVNNDGTATTNKVYCGAILSEVR